MTRPIDPVILAILMGISEVRNANSNQKPYIELSGETLKYLDGYLSDSLEFSKETAPLRKDGTKYNLFGCDVVLREVESNTLIIQPGNLIIKV